MAQFVPPTPKEEVPNYLGYSRGFSASDVMATADTSLGKLFGNIGGVIDKGTKGIKQVFDEKIKSDAYDLIDPIRAAHGGDLSPGEVIPIAGTGARGAKYESAGGAGEDLAMGEARPLPKEAQAELGGLRRMKAAYEGGGLSNSHYSASLLAAAKELRAKYPGFREEVDAAFKGITGQDPANALRASILSDMNSMAAASSSQSNKMMSQYRADAEYWGAVKPNLSFEEYAANWQNWQTTVAGLKADKFKHEYVMRNYAGAKAGTENRIMFAEESAKIYASGLVSSKFSQSLSQVSEDFARIAGQGDKANAGALEEVTNRLGQLKVRMINEFSAWVNKEHPDLPMEKRKAIVENIISTSIDTTQHALQNKETGVAYAAARIATQAGSQATLKIEREFPAALALKGWRGIVGDTAATAVYNSLQGRIQPRILEDINNNAFGVLANTTPGVPVPKASGVIKLQQEHGVSSGAATKITLKTALEMAKSSDPERAYRAVQFLYADPDLWKNLKRGEAKQLYTLLGSREFTNKMITLGKTRPEAFEVYSGWMETNFTAVSNEAIGNLQSVVANTNYDSKFDPATLHWTVKKKGASEWYNAKEVQPYINKLNALSDLIAPILQEKYKDQAPNEFLRIIAGGGYDPSAPKSEGFYTDLFKAVSKTLKDILPENGPVEPFTPKGKGRRPGWSAEDILGVDIQDVPEGMSAREFIKKLQKQSKQ